MLRQRRDALFSEFQLGSQPAILVLCGLPLLRRFLQQLSGQAFIALPNLGQRVGLRALQGGAMRVRCLQLRVQFLLRGMSGSILGRQCRMVGAPLREFGIAHGKHGAQLRQFLFQYVHAQGGFDQRRVRDGNRLFGVRLETHYLIQLHRHCGMPQLADLVGRSGGNARHTRTSVKRRMITKILHARTYALTVLRS
jgi:hypothetical protein